MKKIITIAILLSITNTIQAQTESRRYLYLVGSKNIPGYELQTQECTLFMDEHDSSFHAPILVCIANDKNNFIGGVLENESGGKTQIVDIKLEYKNKVTTMTVVGKDFSKSIETTNGVLLKNDNEGAFFCSSDNKIWKMYIKK